MTAAALRALVTNSDPSAPRFVQETERDPDGRQFNQQFRAVFDGPGELQAAGPWVSGSDRSVEGSEGRVFRRVKRASLPAVGRA